MLVRAFGVTHTWFEVVPAAVLLLVVVAPAIRIVPTFVRIATRYAELWPVALGLVVLGGYFVVPNVVGGISGINERLPLFAAMLLIPFVPASGKLPRALAIAAVPFYAYVAVINEVHERGVRELRDAADQVAIERGSIIYPVSLDLKLGTVSADLGRYLGADIARRHDAITANVFYGNPVFPLLGTAQSPTLADITPVQSFSHLSAAEQSAWLADEASPIRRFFDDTIVNAAGARYMVVIPYPPLDDAFRVHVLAKMGARLAKGSTSVLPIYELPQRIDSAVADAR
jgi:hypothetical protein